MKPYDPVAGPTIAVIVPTYRRPHGLSLLLDHLERVDAPGPVRVVVAENDAAEAAGAALAQARAPSYRFPLLVAPEPRRGQTYAYNRGFSTAARLDPAPDYVAVLDDDEYPSQAWLRELVRVAQGTGAGIVGGPVFPRFAAPGHWLARTPFYEPARFPTGPVPAIYGAGNMMIRRSVLERYLDEPFSHAFAFTGGSDLDFFRRCQRDGVAFAWADEAHVYETVPEARLSPAWLLRRAFRKGTDLARTDRRYRRGPAQALFRLAKGPGLVAAGLARTPRAVLAGRPGLLAAGLTAARGVGRIAGEFNLLYEEYRETDGR